MLEKNKDYVEFTLQYTSVDWARSKDYPEVCLKGYSNFSFPGVPMDVVCKEFDHKVVMISKSEFDRLQANNEHYHEMAKQWEHNHELLLRMTGFNTLEELTDYIHDAGKNSIGNYKTLKEIADDAEEDYISERVTAKTLQTENEQLKKKLEEFSPAPGYREFLTALYPDEDVEKLVWATEQICGRDLRHTLQVDLEYYRALSTTQAKSIYCWKEVTGCPTPEAAKTLIESGMSYEYAYHEAQKENRKLTEEVDSWKNVTGYSIPEDYLHARISGAFHTPFDYTAAWQKATGCDTPEAAKKRISGLISEVEAWESDYNHLLALTGFDNEGEIEDFLEQNNDRNKLTTVIDNLKLENEAMKTALRASNLAMQKELDQEIDNWQKATGRIDPEAAKQYIDRLKARLNKIHDYSVDWDKENF